jgi:hypothetical protein
MRAESLLQAFAATLDPHHERTDVDWLRHEIADAEGCRSHNRGKLTETSHYLTPPSPALRGARRLGWPLARAPRNMRRGMGLNNCALGCPTGAKQSILVTVVWRGRRAAGVRGRLVERDEADPTAAPHARHRARDTRRPCTVQSRSEWKITPATLPPRVATAIRNASHASSVRRGVAIAHPITRRENTSST